MNRFDIIPELRKFISHSDNIMRHSVHYRDLKHTRAMATAKSILVIISKPADFNQVARFILQNQTHLYGILPDHRNSSYLSSLQRLEGILKGCREIIIPRTERNSGALNVPQSTVAATKGITPPGNPGNDRPVNI